MKALFEILPAKIDTNNCTLFCEISYECFSFAIKNEEQNKFVGVAVFELEKAADEKEYANVLEELINKQPLLADSFKKVYIIYSFKECVLIPFNLYSSLENENVLKLVHGDIQSNSFVLTDLITENGVYNTYRVGAPIVSMLQKKFPDAENIHRYSVSLKQPQPEGDKLKVIFYPQRIIVKLSKNGKTEFINSFNYRTKEEASYILLNTSTQYEANNIPVEVSGLIEKNSALYKEIYKYFETVSFDSLPAGLEYAEEIMQQPSHYFSHIFSAVSCE